MNKIRGTVKTKKLRWTTAIVSAIALGVVFCSVGVSASTAAVSRVAVPHTSKPTIALIQIGANNPFWTAENVAADAAANEHGFTMKILSGNNSVSTQSSEIEQLANEHVSAIIICAIDPASMHTAFAYAKARGVPVISIYSSSKQATMSAGFDEERVGHDMAVFSLKLLEERYGSAKGTVAVLGLSLGQTLETYRIGGFVSTLAQYPNIHVVSEQPTNSLAATAQSLMEDWLTRYPSLSLIYGGSDTVTVPAITIAQRDHRVCDVATKSWKSNPHCIIYTSVDGDPIGIAAIRAGTLAGTDLYAPYWAGYQFAMMGYDLATHKISPRTMVLQALPVDGTNVSCINKMQTAMANHLSTFNFNGTLVQIAKRYGCPTVTISGGPPLKGGQQF